MLRTSLAALLLPLAFACSEPVASVPDEEVAFAPREGLDPSAWLRPVNLAFHSAALDLTAAPDGSVWLLRREWHDERLHALGERVLSHYNSEGSLLAELHVPDGVQRLVAHPSGELTVVGWKRSRREEIQRTTVELRRLRPDGTVIAQRTLRSRIPLAQRLTYGVDAGGNVFREAPTDEERFVRVVDLVAYGEDAYLLSEMDGLRVLRLDSTLNTRWMSPIAPSIRLHVRTEQEAERLGGPFRNPRLTVDEAGRPYVAAEFPPVAGLAYWDAFARLPEGPEGKAFLLMGLESTGEPGVARAIAAEDALHLVHLDVRSGAFALGARVRSRVFDQPDRWLDTDLFFASGRLDRPASEEVHRILALDQDDEPEAFMACGAGLYCFAGHTGHVILNTQRTVSDGDGFVLAVDARGEPHSLTRIQGPRDTKVGVAAAAPGGAITFAFTTNGPADLDEAPAPLRFNALWLGRLNTP